MKRVNSSLEMGAEFLASELPLRVLRGTPQWSAAQSVEVEMHVRHGFNDREIFGEQLHRLFMPLLAVPRGTQSNLLSLQGWAFKHRNLAILAKLQDSFQSLMSGRHGSCCLQSCVNRGGGPLQFVSMLQKDGGQCGLLLCALLFFWYNRPRSH